MEKPLIIKLESARGEILNAIQSIQIKYNLPACILDGTISQVLNEIRAQEKMELLNANNQMLKEIQDEQKGEK